MRCWKNQVVFMWGNMRMSVWYTASSNWNCWCARRLHSWPKLNHVSSLDQTKILYLISFHFWLLCWKHQLRPSNTHAYRRCWEPRGASWLGMWLIRKCTTDLTTSELLWHNTNLPFLKAHGMIHRKHCMTVKNIHLMTFRSRSYASADGLLWLSDFFSIL